MVRDLRKISSRCPEGAERFGMISSVGDLYISSDVVSPGMCLLGQVSTDMDEIVGDNSESYPTTDAGWSFVERPPQPVPAFENTDATFTARAPLLKLLEPTLLLALLAGGTFGVVAGNGDPADPHLLGPGL